MPVASSSLPTTYSQSRERRRRRSLAVGWILILGFGATSVIKSVPIGIGIVAFVIGLLLVVPLIIRIFISFRLGRSPEVGIKIPAQLPAFVVRSQGVDVPTKYKDTAEFLGSLSLDRGSLEWTVNPRSVRIRGLSSLTWSAYDITRWTVTALPSLIPMCLLHLETSSTNPVDFWIRRPASFLEHQMKISTDR